MPRSLLGFGLGRHGKCPVGLPLTGARGAAGDHIPHEFALAGAPNTRGLPPTHLDGSLACPAPTALVAAPKQGFSNPQTRRRPAWRPRRPPPPPSPTRHHRHPLCECAWCPASRPAPAWCWQPCRRRRACAWMSRQMAPSARPSRCAAGSAARSHACACGWQSARTARWPQRSCWQPRARPTWMKRCAAALEHAAAWLLPRRHPPQQRPPQPAPPRCSCATRSCCRRTPGCRAWCARCAAG